MLMPANAKRNPKTVKKKIVGLSFKLKDRSFQFDKTTKQAIEQMIANDNFKNLCRHPLFLVSI